MQKISKYLPFVIAVCAIADTSFDVLVGIGLNPTLINYIKLIGLLTSVLMPILTKISEEEEIQVPVPTNPLIKSNSEEAIDPNNQYGKRPKKKGEIDEDTSA